MIQSFYKKEMIYYRPKHTLKKIDFLKPESLNDSNFKKPINSPKDFYSQQLKV
jgi:hypothetical protein